MPPGRHDIDANELPFLGSIIDHFTDDKAYRAELYFVGTREYVGNTFGGRIDNVQDPQTGMLVTLRVFLGQVLSADHSCRAAVARLNAHRVARGQRPCSARTGAYCRARRRLPEGFFSADACSVGRGLDAKAGRAGCGRGGGCTCSTARR